MSPLTLDLEKEISTLAPDEALQFERVVREILCLVRAKKSLPAAESKAYQLPAFSMGVHPAIDMSRLGQLAEDF